MAATFRRDEPWRRLPLEAAAALLLTLLALFAFHKMLSGGLLAPAPPAPVTMEVVVLPPAPPPPAPLAPAASAAAPEVPPPARPQPEAAPAPLPREAAPRESHRPAPQARPEPKRAPEAAKPQAPAPAAPVATVPPSRAPAPEAATVPPAATAPLTAAEQAMIAANRKQRAEALYQPGGRASITQDPGYPLGNGESGPPLTAEEARALDEVYLVGAVAMALPHSAPLRAALSPRAPPLTREQWEALDRIYHVGLDYTIYEEYRRRLAAINNRESLATLADLTPEERRLVLARRGALPVQRGLSVSMSHTLTLIDSTDPRLYTQRGAPPVVLAVETPELPEALRQQPAQWLAVARLHIDRDGTATAELTQSSGDETVDRAVLQALQHWRFRSAFYGYHFPVASTDELRLTLIVK